MPFDGTQLPLNVKTLLEAKAYMQEHGWCQRAYQTQTGEVCMMGAVRAVTKHDVYLMANVEWFLNRALPPYWSRVVDFNDLYTRTYEEVVAHWDRAITLAMSEENANA